jgi:hypothetical protein
MDFQKHSSRDSLITSGESGSRLEIASGSNSRYRLAQLDDYSSRGKKDFLWKPPLTLSLHARASSSNIPGTWGFGLWNDPFGTWMGPGGMKRPFPALPNAVWFFHASQENYLSLRNDRPANGFMAAIFSSPKIPAILLLPSIIVAPLLLIRSTARWLRSKLRQVIEEDNVNIDIDVMEWHQYSFTWAKTTVRFWVDDQLELETRIVPDGPLGCVIWIDNQFASFTPDGRIKAGTLENPVPAWIEISDFVLR